MDEKELQKLFDVVSEHLDIGDFDYFKSKMQTPDERRSFYDAVGEKGYDLGDYDVYESRLTGSQKKKWRHFINRYRIPVHRWGLKTRRIRNCTARIIAVGKRQKSHTRADCKR